MGPKAKLNTVTSEVKLVSKLIDKALVRTQELKHSEQKIIDDY